MGDNKADDLESKTSQLQQSKRSNDNLRRQINEMKLEKDSLYVELTTLRSRLSKLEATKAEVDLELKKAANIKESDFEIVPESKDQVCGILNISDSEFKSIMNAHESDTPSEGNSSSDWLGSIAEVIAAGPPFSDTITNSFRLKLNDLIAYTA